MTMTTTTGSMALDVEASPLESRPAILLVGSPNVGKRTILSRLLSIDSGDDTLDSTTGMLCHGWTIDTKYYSVDVSIWTVHLEDEFSLRALPMPSTLAALLMVFDLNDLESFSTLKSWVSNLDLTRFDILLCIGNKIDLLSGHFAHAEYRRHLEKCGASSGDPHLEFAGYGILDTEGSSLLGEDEIPWEIRRSCLDWCLQHNIEYVEACASNPVFDKCLSVNGDVQGMDRIYGALSAHMWPGMVLKSGNRVVKTFSLENEDLDASDEGSEFELEYEVLSRGSVEPWDSDDSWVAFTEAEPQVGTGEGPSSQGVHIFDVQPSDSAVTYKTEGPPSTSEPMFSMNGNSGASILEKFSVSEERLLVGNLRQGDKQDGHFSEPEETFVCTSNSNSLGSEDGRVRSNQNNENHEEKLPEHEDLEHLMSEIGTVRDNLRLMPDFQRREMAAMLAMKVAAMFGCGSDDEGSE